MHFVVLLNCIYTQRCVCYSAYPHQYKWVGMTHTRITLTPTSVLMFESLNRNAVRIVTRYTWSCNGAGGKDRQQALSLQVEEMLLLHLKELLLDGNLLGCQLSQRENNIHQETPPPYFLLNTACYAFCLHLDSGKKS